MGLRYSSLFRLHYRGIRIKYSHLQVKVSPLTPSLPAWCRRERPPGRIRHAQLHGELGVPVVILDVRLVHPALEALPLVAPMPMAMHSAFLSAFHQPGRMPLPTCSALSKKRMKPFLPSAEPLWRLSWSATPSKL